MEDLAPPFVYDQAAFESLCAELVRAGFGPVPGTALGHWRGRVPEYFASLTDAASLELKIVDGWPAVSLRAFVPGLVADHVLTESGYICLWADDDPSQINGQTWQAFEQRLRAWVSSATNGFGSDDRSLDAWALFPSSATRTAELDIPALLGRPTDGDIHVVHGKIDPMLTLSNASEGHPLAGVVLYRKSVRLVPRSFQEYLAALTRRQRKNVMHGVARRTEVGEGEQSGGYDFVVLIWPKHDQYDALVLSFTGAGESLVALPNPTAARDTASRLRRAGPDAPVLRSKRVLIAGVGAVGGQVALTLASSGLGLLRLHDGDELQSVNLVRHVLEHYAVGHGKAAGMRAKLAGTAPWTEVEVAGFLTRNPNDLLPHIRGFDLVVDCTGFHATTLALAQACELENVPLLSVSLFRGGSVVRVHRQLEGDLPILRRSSPQYPVIPPGSGSEDVIGFLELGCTALVHNAPPASVTRAAADTALAALDILAGRETEGEMVVTVLRALDQEPYAKRGVFVYPQLSPGEDT
jgi:molybdopterin/thiamine biosynthesis adenylyltransferase